MDRTIDYKPGILFMIDQTLIPQVLKQIEIHNYLEAADAISTMKVRGAPAIGVAAAAGIALAAHNSNAANPAELINDIEKAAVILKDTRPTAVNLFWGIDRAVSKAKSCLNMNISSIRKTLDELIIEMLNEDEEVNRAMGKNGASLLPDKGNVLTHCNAGSLACVSYGTALGVIRAAIEMGKDIHVYADETRPRLQGMKLTCFELVNDSIPVTLIADNMAASLMRKGLINCVIVGADRIAANGDAANKIGTYSLAVVAKYHNVPFYVAAPTSTIDMSLKSGDEIQIEDREHEEMTHIDGVRIAPEGINTINPSFDVTPFDLITKIITEKGFYKPD